MTNQNIIHRAQWAAALALLSFVGYATVSTGHGKSPALLERVRGANDRFKDVVVAVSEGYSAIPCASGTDGGAMGIHYVSSKLIAAGTIDIEYPQAVMYEPMADGKMMLIGVEYITSKGPASLEGQLFNFTGAPNRYGLGPFYALHVWAWKTNPRGAFADMNPDVTCEHSSSEHY
jgi:hypothetical protein